MIGFGLAYSYHAIQISDSLSNENVCQITSNSEY